MDEYTALLREHSQKVDQGHALIVKKAELLKVKRQAEAALIEVDSEIEATIAECFRLDKLLDELEEKEDETP